ncbi:S9 family peptidase [Myroides sp. N17-2]|uniref:alpha/beta hydrolase family protein n=1 Tax=Myroides sp. N17-2 TaxID=2030799 RepID=UPI000EFC688E|nr:prolyl oligopeptidase family serine peptidase [Myroides sp. N17-2]
MVIKYLLSIIVILFLSITISAKTSETKHIENNLSTQDSLNEISRIWIKDLSPNGKTALINSSNSSLNETHLITTSTNKTIHTFQGNNQTYLNEKTIVSLNNSTLSFFDIKTNKTNKIEHIRDYDVIKSNNIIITNSTDSYKSIYNSKAIKLWEDSMISFFSINQNNSKALYLKQDNTVYQLYLLDLTSYKTFLLQTINYPIIQANWDKYNNRVALVVKDKNTTNEQLMLLNLNDNTYQNVTLQDLKHTEKLLQIRTTFFKQSSDFYITYFVQANSEKDNIDIWSTKDKKLHLKNPSTSTKTTEKKYNKLWNNKHHKLLNLDSLASGQEILCINSANTFIVQDIEKFQDYTKARPDIELSIITLDSLYKTKLENKINTGLSSLTYSTFGGYISYLKDEGLFIYDTKTKEKRKIDSLIKMDVSNTCYWDKQEKFLFYIKQGNLYKYDLKNHYIIKLTNYIDNKYKLSIENSTLLEVNRYSMYNRQPNLVDGELLIQLTDKESLSTKYISISGTKLKDIISESNNFIKHPFYTSNLKTFIYSEENHNTPPQIKINRKENNVLYKNSLQNVKLDFSNQITINYTNAYNQKLKGTLYYPKKYDNKKKYPLIVHIYEIQSENRNRFLFTTDKMSLGFNPLFYTKDDYFVFLPDIVFNNEGTGLSALDCLNNAMDTLLQQELNIDKTKMGIIGHSHGGYLTNFIITQSHIFSAAVSGAGNADLVKSYFSYNYNFSRPFYFQFESGQYRMEQPFYKNKQLYFANSPILYADRIKTPLLTWTGNKDENINWQQTQEMFISLLRTNKVPHIALFYKDEKHTIDKKENQLDLQLRIKAWFDYFLKGKKDINWITENI